MNSVRTIAIGCFTALTAACGGGRSTSTTPQASPAPSSASAGGAQSETAPRDAGPGTTETNVAVVTSSPEPSAAPSSPPPPAEPRVALGEDLTPDVAGLPAISADGSTIAVADVAHDGLRGAPNLTLRPFNAQTGAARPVIAVLSVAEGVRAAAGNVAATAALRRTVEPRLARAQAAIQGYRPLAALGFDAAAPDAATFTGRHGGVELTFTTATGDLNVTDAATHATRYHATIPASRAAGERRNPNCSQNPALVREAWIDPGINVLVAHIEYSGTDSCISPDGSYRVVRLAVASGAPPAH